MSIHLSIVLKLFNLNFIRLLIMSEIFNSNLTRLVNKQSDTIHITHLFNESICINTIYLHEINPFTQNLFN